MEHQHEHERLNSTMLMYLHGGYNEIVLFNFWNIENVNTFILTCLLWILIAIISEWLRMFRRKLLQTEYQYNLFVATKIRHTELINESNRGAQEPTVCLTKDILSSSHIVQTILYFFQVLIGYSLMLVVMTFNIWICLSVALGSTIGYFIFGRTYLDVGHIH